VIVVGGGVIGCATAYYLARGGADTLLLERGELAGEASGAAAGMLAALSDEGGNRGPAFQALCLDSLSLFESLLPELASTGVDVRYRDAGVLHLALDDAEAERLRDRYESQRAVAPENVWLDRPDLPAVEPEATSRAHAGLLCPKEHYLDPQRLTLAFAAAARSAGAHVETRAEVTSIVTSGGRVAGVRASGSRLEADHVLLAGGPWTGRLAAGLGSYVPVRPVRGQMLSLDGPPRGLRHVIWGSRAYLVPREDGQTFVGATVEEAGFRRRTTRTGVAGLRRGAAELAPSLSEAAMLRSWAGLRPASPDLLPIMGLLPGYANVWVSTGHFRNGILLAPSSGLLLARSILAGAEDPSLAPFSPARFLE
jgi:glycine oxidase